MSPNSLKNAREEQVKPDDTKTKLKRFIQQLNTLDMRTYGTWPIAIKLSCYVFCFLLVCLIGYFVVIQPQLQAIDSAVLQQQQLLDEYKEKSSKLRNLKQYQTSLLQMEKQFNQQLQLLPKASEIPSLLDEIQRAGQKSGLKIVNIQLENEQQQTFFIEQPIRIEARGDYHAYGRFASYLAELPRIVTLHDFMMVAETDPMAQSDVPMVAFSIKAKTYRYINRAEQNKAAAQSSLPSVVPAQTATAPAIVSTPTAPAIVSTPTAPAIVSTPTVPAIVSTPTAPAIVSTAPAIVSTSTVTVIDSNTASQQEARPNVDPAPSEEEQFEQEEQSEQEEQVEQSVAFVPKQIALSASSYWVYAKAQAQLVTEGA